MKKLFARLEESIYKAAGRVHYVISIWVALIKSMVFGFILLLGIAIPASSLATDDELLLEELRESLEKGIGSEMADRFRSELKESGMAPIDAERIVEELVDASVVCFVGSLVKHAQTHETPLADLVHEFEDEMGIAPVGGDFEDLLNRCLNAVRLEAGIALD